MVANQDTMKRIFLECNEKYFNNSLPTPSLKTFNEINVIGRFEYFNNKKSTKKPITGQTIFMSDCFIYPKKDFVDTMVHEMIHYYLAWNKIKDNETHGNEFMKMANNMNERYGLNIAIKKDASSYRLTKNAPKIIKNKKTSKSLFSLNVFVKPISHIITALRFIKII
jgi:hypothetical protein